MQAVSYGNTQSSVYPFICNIPFPLGIIKNIKIALKNSIDTPFVSSIVKTSQTFAIEISTVQKVLGSFIYNGNNFINLNNQQIYGFIQLGFYPVKDINCIGKYYIHKSCYTYAVDLEGIKTLKINNKSYVCPRILKIDVNGDCNLTSEDNIITIARSQEPLYSYFQKSADNTQYVLSINSTPCQSLFLHNNQQAIIHINNPELRKDNSYVIYISTSQEFPVCEGQKRQL